MGRLKPYFMCSLLGSWEHNTSYEWSRTPGHMTKMATVPIYGKNPVKIFFSETSRLMTLQLCIQHLRLRHKQFHTNDDPEAKVICTSKHLFQHSHINTCLDSGEQSLLGDLFLPATSMQNFKALCCFEYLCEIIPVIQYMMVSCSQRNGEIVFP